MCNREWAKVEKFDRLDGTEADWRSYTNDRFATLAEAMTEPFAAFPRPPQ
jgi:hypothetical protein